MPTATQGEIRDSLKRKLHPRRFTGMSGKMAAIVAYVVGERWTNPGIAELAITGDGMVLARREGDVGCNDFIGSAGDLERNVSNLLTAAELNGEERAAWNGLYQAAMTDWRR